jgi:hypothetical protein
MAQLHRYFSLDTFIADPLYFVAPNWRGLENCLPAGPPILKVVVGKWEQEEHNRGQEEGLKNDAGGHLFHELFWRHFESDEFNSGYDRAYVRK